jgi:cytochrome P450
MAHNKFLHRSRARKGVAKAFSVSNLTSALPKIYKKLDEAIAIVSKYAAEKKAFDVDLLGVDLTLDFIASSMLGMVIGRAY